MSEEEKKAIKYYESEIDLAKRLDEVIVNGRIEPLEKIINLTKKQQKEIEKLKQDFYIVDHECERLEKIDVEKDITITKQSKDISNNLLELQKKDKIIDLMANHIATSDSDLCEYLDITTKCKYYAGDNGKTCDNCIKQYFEKKVSKENE